MSVGEHGFGELTLSKVLGITVAVSLLTTIVIPWVLSTDTIANEANAISSLRNLAIAQEVYRERRNPPEYARSLADLSGLIGKELASGVYRGYSFYAGPADASAFSYVCEPAGPGAARGRSFFIDQSGIIRSTSGGRVTALSPPLH